MFSLLFSFNSSTTLLILLKILIYIKFYFPLIDKVTFIVFDGSLDWITIIQYPSKCKAIGINSYIIT